jgi:hypothetical protein
MSNAYDTNISKSNACEQVYKRFLKEEHRQKLHSGWLYAQMQMLNLFQKAYDKNLSAWVQCLYVKARKGLSKISIRRSSTQVGSNITCKC